jgi:hypothetical protein
LLVALFNPAVNFPFFAWCCNFPENSTTEAKMPVIKKSWPRIRPSKNGAGVESWEVDLRPHGKREYYPTRKEAKAAARIARVQHERGKVLVTSAALSKRQILDAQVAFNLLKGTNVTLTEAVCDYLDRHHFGAAVELSNE